jgi:hypothetical protein
METPKHSVLVGVVNLMELDPSTKNNKQLFDEYIHNDTQYEIK